VYHEDELVCMLADIAQFRDLSAGGVVVGALTLDGEIDVKATARFRQEAAHGMELTFHRAIDMAQDPVVAIQVRDI
jgi:copper homeostasis protein